MNLYKWYELHGRNKLERLAKKVSRSPDYLSLVMRGHRNASHKLAIDIECKTKGEVTRHDLRPDIFGESPEKAA